MNIDQLFQRAGGVVNHTLRSAERTTRALTSEAYGLIQRARHLRPAPKPGMDDVTLARKVETEIFRDGDAPRQSVNVNVVDGVVWLRGEVKTPDQVQALVRKAQAVPEVSHVENLLHTKGSQRPTRRQHRTRSAAPERTRRSKRTGQITDDRTDRLSPGAEPSPAEHVRDHEGRTPAPFGSTESQGSAGTDGSPDR
jgi:hypothetical protein